MVHNTADAVERELDKPIKVPVSKICTAKRCESIGVGRGAGGAGAPPGRRKKFSMQFLLKRGKNGVNLARCTPVGEIKRQVVTNTQRI